MMGDSLSIYLAAIPTGRDWIDCFVLGDVNEAI